jgi:hypothetical protein
MSLTESHKRKVTFSTPAFRQSAKKYTDVGKEGKGREGKRRP